MTRLRTSTRRPLLAAAALASLVLAGCSGLGGSSSLTCKMPDGVRCDSVSNTYSESTRGELPSQRRRQAPMEPSPSGTSSTSQGGDVPLMQVDPRMVPVGMPVRSQARVVRVWIKAWEDADGDLHDQTFVYLPVTEGRWLVEHKQREIRNAYAPTRTSTNARPAMNDARPTVALPPAPNTPSTTAPAAAPSNKAATERMTDAVQKARGQQPASNVVRNEGGRSGS